MEKVRRDSTNYQRVSMAEWVWIDLPEQLPSVQMPTRAWFLPKAISWTSPLGSLIKGYNHRVCLPTPTSDTCPCPIPCPSPYPYYWTCSIPNSTWLDEGHRPLNYLPICTLGNTSNVGSTAGRWCRMGCYWGDIVNEDGGGKNGDVLSRARI